MQKIIEELRYFNPKFPYGALEEAIENPEKIIPLLLDELDDSIEHPDEIARDEMLYIYAIYLLAQFREKKAFSRILQLVSLPSEQVEELFGTIITEDLNTLLYSTFNGDFQALKGVIENPSVYTYVRGAALEVYGKLYADDEVSKNEIISYFRELLMGNGKVNVDIDLATSIQGIIIDRHLFEMVEDVQNLYDERRIDEKMVGAFDDFIDYMYTYRNGRESVHYLEDTIKAMDWWASFEQTQENKAKEEERIKHLDAMYEEMKQSAQAPVAKKVGRNDPCPCGSGKKYKKCCMKKEIEELKKGKEPLEVQQKWLRDYPKLEGERQANEVRLSDHFDEEAIEIDRFVYLAFHRRARPIWETADKELEEKAKKVYLKEAYAKYQKKCEQENISSFEAYDSEHKIHYRSKDWVENFGRLIEEENAFLAAKLFS